MIKEIKVAWFSIKWLNKLKLVLFEKCLKKTIMKNDFFINIL